ncbi:MAG: ThiF family adenylyltransferase [Bacillota bacterium]|nr:thiamine biosynthesis protein ThiF [Bacillota bacterium]
MHRDPIRAADFLPPLSEVEKERYSRQIRFAPIGEEGQRRLRQARVAIVGVGALGAALANHMARAGVGYIRLIDGDIVDVSNLPRQMLFDEEDARKGNPKAAAAAEKLSAVNSAVEIEPHVTEVTWQNADQLLSDVHLLLDGTDNFATRYLLNDVSVKYGIPYVYGGIIAASGSSAFFWPGKTPCLACLYPEPPQPGSTDTCETAGIIGPVVHFITAYQATEALKYLTGNYGQLWHWLLSVDLWHNQLSRLPLDGKRRPDCPVCAHRRFRFLEEQQTVIQETVLCGKNTVQIRPAQPVRHDLQALAQRLSSYGRVEQNRFLVRLHLKQHALTFFQDGRVLVQGTDDVATARRLYAQYLGM